MGEGEIRPIQRATTSVTAARSTMPPSPHTLQPPRPVHWRHALPGPYAAPRGRAARWTSWVSALALLVCTVGLVSGCAGRAGGPAAHGAAQTESAKPGAGADAPGGASTKPAETSLAETAAIPVDQTLSDDLLGRHYRIVSYVPSIPVPADFAEAYPVYAGATLVALEVELTVDPDTPYATAAHPFDLTLHCGSTDAPESAANTLLTEVYADQFPPAASAEPGATTSGWIGFRTVNQCGGAPYTVVARRQGSDRVRGRPGRAGQSGDKEPPDQASLPYAEFTLELPPAPAG